MYKCTNFAKAEAGRLISDSHDIVWVLYCIDIIDHESITIGLWTPDIIHALLYVHIM